MTKEQQQLERISETYNPSLQKSVLADLTKAFILGINSNNASGPRWVKASERLPEVDGKYFVRVRKGEFIDNDIAHFTVKTPRWETGFASHDIDDIRRPQFIVFEWLDETPAESPVAPEKPDWWNERIVEYDKLINQLQGRIKEMESPVSDAPADEDKSVYHPHIPEYLEAALDGWVKAHKEFDTGYRNINGKATRMDVAALSQSCNQADTSLRKAINQYKAYKTPSPSEPVTQEADTLIKLFNENNKLWELVCFASGLGRLSHRMDEHEESIQNSLFKMADLQEAAQASQGWVSVEERLPEVGEDVEIITDDDDRYIGFLDNNGMLISQPMLITTKERFRDYVVRWRKLPAVNK